MHIQPPTPPGEIGNLQSEGVSMADELVNPVVEASDTFGKTCFVIMPFGQKRDILSDGQTQEIDFDQIYRQIIKPTVERLKLQCTRSDEVSKSGLIHKDMIERILSSDLVVVDITTLNANVFYELGIRHTAQLSGTVLVHMANKPIPFNIGGMRVVEYQCDSPEAIAHSQDILETNIRNSLIDRNVDSLVHALIPGLRVSRRPTPIKKSEVVEFSAPELGERRLGIITGDIIQVEGVDIWVNPENTKMEMARLHDDSVSACIRYFGAKRSRTGQVKRDTIAAELRRRIGTSMSVEPGTVIPTSAGQLKRTHGVKVILHVAGQYGEPGKGYMPIRNYTTCVVQALKSSDWLNRNIWSRWRYDGPFRSIIFPLFGTRSSDRDPQDVTDNLIFSAKTFLEARPDSAVERVYFLAYTDADRYLCETALSRLRLQRK
jgi:O-acetyl-ADP-ribose deacetylase (regulator of RNase III)